MYRLFNPENKFWNFIAKLADVTCMSILWAVVSLPIFTAGAATTAFYDFTMHQVRDTEGGVWLGFFRPFKAHFKKATALWLIELAGIAFFGLDLWAAWNFYTVNGGMAGIALLSFCTCCTVIFFSCFLYLYPMLAIFGFRLKKLIGNSFVMAMGNLHVTITLFVLSALVGVGLYYASGLFFLWIGLYIFFSSYFITGVFGKYIRNEEDRDGKERPEG